MVIATVFLTIIGMTAGFVLGERHRHTVPAAATTRTTTTTSEPSRQSPPATWPAGSTATACPPETLRSAVELKFPEDLRQVLKIQTDNGTTVWICQDAAGRFYYQSKTGGLDAPLIQGTNGLFLFQVTQAGVDDYVCTDNLGTRIEVTRKQLVVRPPVGKTSVYQVSSVE